MAGWGRWPAAVLRLGLSEPSDFLYQRAYLPPTRRVKARPFIVVWPETMPANCHVCAVSFRKAGTLSETITALREC